MYEAGQRPGDRPPRHRAGVTFGVGATTHLCVPFGVAEVGYALTDVTSATLQASLSAVIRGVEADRGEQMPTRMAIIAMGRYGGYELGYGSDADVMFVHDPVEEAEAQVAASYAQAVIGEVRRLLSLPASDPPLEVDVGSGPNWLEAK